MLDRDFMAQTLGEIRRLMGGYGLRPKHRLGQNFLHDGNQMRRIVEAAGVCEGDVVLEVGAGTGALTERLLEAGARVVAVEVDHDLQPILGERLGGWAGRVTLVGADVLRGKHEVAPEVLGAVEGACGVGDDAGCGFKLVANLPYSVASPLLANLAVRAGGPVMRLGVVMVQQEVADRLAAVPGGKDYGALSVVVQARFEVRALFRVPPDCFWPAPKVYSAVVALTPRERLLAEDLEQLGRTAKRLFSQRRKQLGTVLGRREGLPEGIDASARPEDLTVEQFAVLSGWLGDGGGC